MTFSLRYAILIISTSDWGCPSHNQFKGGKNMCPISPSAEFKIVHPEAPVAESKTGPMVACEVAAGDVFERFNLPTFFKVGDDGPLTLGFGKFNKDGAGRDHQFKITVLNPGETPEELRSMIDDWYRLGNLAKTSSKDQKSEDQRKEAQNTLGKLKARFLAILSRPAMVEFRTQNLAILHPIEPGTEVCGSFLIYTTFEADDEIEIPENEGVLHGKFKENGHVIAVLITTDQKIMLWTPRGYNIPVPWDAPAGTATRRAVFSDDAEHNSEPAPNGEFIDVAPSSEGEHQRRPRSGRKPAAVGAGTGRGKGSRRVNPNDVEDE